MPISLRDLQNKPRSFQFEWEGEAAEIVYNAMAYTPALEAEMVAEANDDLPGQSTAKALSRVLVRWELVGADGQELGVDYDTLRKIPVAFLTALLVAIGQEQTARREERKNSAGGSLQAAS